MKLLTRDADYAVRAICYIVQAKGRVVTVGELCEKLKIARPFLRTILQKLHHSGILNASKGRNGGFVLNRDAGAITILDIMCVFQGNEGFVQCRTAGKNCQNMPVCPLRKRLKKIEKDLFAALSGITVKSLLDEI
jgi:Rrf2 family nitric oxide-sensitive transcriptional repressor